MCVAHTRRPGERFVRILVTTESVVRNSEQVGLSFFVEGISGTEKHGQGVVRCCVDVEAPT
jgi:hypothetical protein